VQGDTTDLSDNLVCVCVCVCVCLCRARWTTGCKEACRVVCKRGTEREEGSVTRERGGLGGMQGERRVVCRAERGG